jgi:hypothetical protein
MNKDLCERQAEAFWAAKLTEARKGSGGAEGIDVFGGAKWCGAAADEQASLDVLADAGLGEVGAGDEQDAPVGDRQNVQFWASPGAQRDGVRLAFGD